MEQRSTDEVFRDAVNERQVARPSKLLWTVHPPEIGGFRGVTITGHTSYGTRVGDARKVPRVT